MGRLLEVSEAQADKESVQQVAPILADSEEPTSAKSVRCQYTAKQKLLFCMLDTTEFVPLKGSNKFHMKANGTIPL